MTTIFQFCPKSKIEIIKECEKMTKISATLLSTATGLLGILIGLYIFVAPTAQAVAQVSAAQLNQKTTEAQAPHPSTAAPVPAKTVDNVHILIITQQNEATPALPNDWEVQVSHYMGGLQDVVWQAYPDVIVLGKGVPDNYGPVLSEYYQGIPVVQLQSMPDGHGVDLAAILKHSVYNKELSREAATSLFVTYQGFRTWFDGTEITNAAEIPNGPTRFQWGHQQAGLPPGVIGQNIPIDGGISGSDDAGSVM